MSYFKATGESDTPMVKYIQDAVSMAQRLYNKYHKQIWIGTPMIPTAIFDYAVIQPNYFFCDLMKDAWQPNWAQNCETVRRMVGSQRMIYQDETPMIAESNISCQKTKIGCQMEIDWHYGTVSGNGHSYTALYQHYNDVFSTSDGAFSKVLLTLVFTWGAPICR